jgi:alkylation response protein AidB-like acyl-CoA dehydrogenase
MDFLLTTEQTEIISASAALLTDRISTTRTRQLLEAGTAPAVADDAWASAAELGWFALGLPEAHDGIGAGLVDEVLLFREIGRAVAPGPFLSTVLAARVACFGREGSLADEITSGRRVGLVIPDALDAIGDGGAVTGDVQLVDAEPDGLCLVVMPGVAAVVETASLRNVTDVPCVDPTTRLLRASGSDAAPVVSVDAAVDPIERRGHVLVAALLTGIVEWSRDTAAEHARSRVQFDRPIGVNQAVKHPCADIAVHAELAHAQMLFAALAVDEGRPDAEFHSLAAHVTAAAAAEFATGATLQIFGGMGFTHEHDVQLYVKRTAVLSRVLGLPGQWLQRLLELPEPV